MKLHWKSLSSFLLQVAFVCAVFVCAVSARADEGDPSSRAGRLSQISGTVSIQPSGINDWSAAAVNYPIAAGDRVYADQDGRAMLEFGNVAARVWSNTDLTVTTLTDDQLQLGLSQGSLHLRTQRLDSTDLIEVDTPNGAVTVVRPGDIRITIYPGDGGTAVSVLSGEVTVSGPGLNEDVQQGQSIRLVGTNPISTNLYGLDQPDDFDNWSRELDQSWQGSLSAQYVSHDEAGYQDLDGNGDWDAGTDYGPVWYPRGVAVDWAPYRYGHWVWSGPWGWTWIEDEPWGYAPFHYGRWVSISGRWGWIPGPVGVRPIWSPALVAFVGGNGFSVGIRIGGGPGLSAWFPLGPGEPYYPWYHTSPHYVDRINITNIRPSRAVIVQRNYFTNDTSHVHYNYRESGITAVRSDNFAAGRPVHGNIVAIDHNRIANAQVIPHPEVAPTTRSLVPNPVNNVRVSNQRPFLMTRDGQQMRAVPGATPQPVPRAPQNNVRWQQQQNQPPAQNNVRTQQAPASQPQNNVRWQQQPLDQQPQKPQPANPPAQNNVRTQQQPAGQPAGLIYRNEPRVAQPSFNQQQPALNQHPGRPLEPQQVDNLQQGKPAGRQRDTEPIQHAQPQPRVAPAPAVQPSRPAPEPAPQRSAPAPRPSPPPAGSDTHKRG